MDDETPEGFEEPLPEPEHQHEHDHAPGRQIYFVTVDWLDEPHQAESSERLARVIARALEHSHLVEPGTPPARFVVRVKAGDVASEVEGILQHHHHHEHEHEG